MRGRRRSWREMIETERSHNTWLEIFAELDTPRKPPEDDGYKPRGKYGPRRPPTWRERAEANIRVWEMLRGRA